MNNKSFRTGKYKGPVFKAKKKNLQFDEERDQDEVKLLITKQEKAETPMSMPGPVIKDRSKIVRRNNPKVEKKYLAESLQDNPYYMLRVSQALDEEDVEEDPTEVKDMTESERRAELLRKSSKTFFERHDLQSSKSLSMYDCWENDLSPEEWISKCQQDPENTHAHCPFYQNDKYIWLPVKVLEYNQGRFLVKLKDGSFQKEVERLSLLFDEEDKNLFKKRVQLAKHYHKRAEDEIRFQTYTEKVSEEQVSKLSEDWIKNIQEKALVRRKKYTEDELVWAKHLSNKIMNTVRAEYIREMKNMVVLNEMKDRKNHQKFQELRIQVRKEEVHIPLYGTIGLLEYHRPFPELAHKLSNSHTTKIPQLVQALNEFSESNFKHVEQNLLCVEFGKELPMRLSAFISKQKTDYAKNLQSIHIQWRDNIASDISEKLSKIEDYNSAIPTIEEYNSKKRLPMKRFLQRIDLIFRDNIRQFAKNNVRSIVNMLRRFVMPDHDDSDAEIWDISTKPLLVLTIKEKKDQKEDEEKDKDKKKGRKERKKTHSNDRDLIVFDPSPEVIISELHGLIDWLIEAINSFTTLEPEIVSMLNLESRPVYNVSKETPLFAEAIANFTDFVTKGLEKPNEILERFKAYGFLLSKSSDEIVNEFLGKDKKKKKSVQELDEYLNKVNSSIKEIQCLCINEKNTQFFQVKTMEIKERLMKKAKKIRTNLTSTINQMTIQKIESIEKDYENLRNKVKIEINDETKLSDTQKVIESFETDLEAFEKEEDECYEFMNLLTKYGCEISDGGVYKFWFLKVNPSQVRSDMKAAATMVTKREKELLDVLIDDKAIFIERLKELQNRFRVFNDISDYSDWKDKEVHITRLDEDIIKADADRKSLMKREKLIGDRVTAFESLDELIKINKPYQMIKKLWRDFEDSKSKWNDGALMLIKYSDVHRKLEEITKELNDQKQHYEPGDNAIGIIKNVIADITEFRKLCPLIRELTKEAIVKNTSYWNEIFKERLPSSIKQSTVTLKMLTLNNVMEYFEHIESVCVRAEEEYGLKKRFKTEIEQPLNDKKVSLYLYKSTGVNVLEKVDELQELYDEKFNQLIVMKQNPFIKAIKAEVDIIEAKLIAYQDMFDSWLKCQRDWMYLEPIFSSDEINRELPLGKQQFDQVHKKWVELMEKVDEDRQIFTYQDWEQIVKVLDSNNEKLESISKMLNHYLESKRSDFPRFYFLSDDELLEILSKAKDPRAVRKYMNKCFEAIQDVQFNSELEVISMISKEQDVISFLKSVVTNQGDRKGKVEIWMGDVEQMMRETLIQKAIDASTDVETPRTKWVLSWPGQIVIAINNIRWTEGVEAAFGNQTIREYYQHLIKERDDIVDMVKGQLSSLERLTLGALIVIDQHAIYVMEMLINEGVSTKDDFDWISQLRYYFNVDKKLRTRTINSKMITSTLEYQYEYLGNSERLVITPLTDRCYRTLMGAFESFYGGAPEGPAGTGKTETVKDLAKAIAVQCVVFNCSDQINFVAMSKFFKGLSQCGAWCCFDEFNRIEPDVLSVIAEQVRTIQMAIKGGQNEFLFEGILCPLKKSAFTCITMNPGYAGRSELPDNLKALFRPCAMMVPDYSLIAEIVLFSYGFRDAQNMAKKVVASLRLSSEQLSTQKHYDFGMRALKAILVAAGNLKKEHPTEDEDRLCLRALGDVNIPKFTQNDIPLFDAIISDLFPKVETIHTDFSLLENTISAVCKDKQLIDCPVFIKKNIELYRTLLVRHGLMLVGGTFSGKTSVIDSLKDSLTRLDGVGEFTKTEKFLLNPKAVTSAQLYGRLDADTKQWYDGILPKIMIFCEEESQVQERKWIVFDGPVDAVWIENMNTVLDDNKILCLTNGQKIKVTDWMNLMFEVEDLQDASPATVSRCGMVFLEPTQLGWEPLLEAYIKFKLPSVMEMMKKWIESKMDWILTPTLVYVHKVGKFPFLIDDMQMICSILKIFDAFCIRFKDREIPFSGKEGESIVNNIILFSVFWGVGVCLEEATRKEFHQFIMKLVYYENVKEEFGLIFDKEWAPNALTLNLGDDIDNLYDIVFDLDSLTWMKWVKTVPTWKPEKDDQLSYNEIIIPTTDTIRNSYFMRLMVNHSHNMLFTGPTGTAKTISVINEIRGTYTNDKFATIMTVFSGQTSANQIQELIESKMNSRRGGKGRFGPEENKDRMLIFIDDVNMPQKEQYGAQPPIELLRMWHDHGYWYDLTEMDKKYLLNMTFVTTMGPPSLGRNMITRRYLRHFFIMYTESFSQSSLETIFSSILDWYFLNVRGKLPTVIVGLKDSIIRATIKVYDSVIGSLLPTPSKSHYLYNLRDISRVFQGITKATLRSFSDANDFIKLWAHECTRVFMDRLVSAEDINLFKETILKKVMNDELKKKWGDLVKHEPLMWADFIPTIYPNGDKTKPPLSGIYCELTNRENLDKYANEYLESFNEQKESKLNLVLFSTAIEHLTRIVRVINTPNGHSFIIGVGGSGKRSLARLSTFIAGFELFQIEITQKYDYNKEWMEDLIEMFKSCGVENNKTVFLFSDNQIFAQEVLEDISSILNQGERPNLFPIQERVMIIDEMSDRYESQVENLTSSQKFEYFLKKCKENIHLVLSFSPVGATFRQHLRTFPSLINCTTIDWFLPWPKTALDSVAKFLMKDIKLDKSKLVHISDIFVRMHEDVTAASVRYLAQVKKYYYVTPKTYLELIYGFKKLYSSNQDKSTREITMYETGLKKLKEAEDQVEEKDRYLAALKPQLEQAQKDTDALIETVREEQKAADVTKGECEIEEAKCNEERKTSNALRDECQEEVDKLTPILEEAVANLKSVERNDIDFLKNMNPASAKPAVKMLFEAFCVLWQFKEGKDVKLIKDPNDQFKKIPDYFSACKTKIFNNPSKMLHALEEYNDEKIDAMDTSIVEKLALMVTSTDQYGDFNFEALDRISSASGKLYNFIKCILTVKEKLILINPKRESLKEAEAKLAKAESDLQLSKDNLQIVEDKIANLTQQLSEAKTKKKNLEDDYNTCNRQKINAGKLIDGLANEKVSWEQRSKKLIEDSVNILGNSILSSGIIAYLGALSKDYREELTRDWKVNIKTLGFKIDPEFLLRSVCCDDLTIGNWVDKYQLPNDSLSIDNAIIMSNSRRYPLIIDPQLQAKRWIENLYKEMIPQSSKTPANKLEVVITGNIQNGSPILVYDVEESIGSMLESLLDQEITEQAGVKKIRFAEKSINLKDTFCLYLTTKLANPHYPPEICAKVTLLNFQVTPEGLEDQLVNLLVANEHVQDSNKWKTSIKKYYVCMENLKQAAQDILDSLNKPDSESSNILEDDELIKTLELSKTTSQDAESTLKDIARIREKMKTLRAALQDCGYRIANMFFCVADMASVEPMYQFSLDWYIDLTQKAMKKDKVKEKELRGEQISKSFVDMLFNRVSRSLFEKDKLLFSFLLYSRILLCDKATTQDEIRKLLISVTNKESSKPNPDPTWISKKMWNLIHDLNEHSPAFSGIDDDFIKNPEEWKKIYQSSAPQEEHYPNNWKVKLSALQSIILLKILRPDKVIPAIQNAIAAKLGREFIEWETIELERVFEDGSKFSPIIFILSSGSDPLDEIFRLANKLSVVCNIVSLGQGQELAADKAIKTARIEGSWIVLQNCHLAPKYLSKVEKSIGEIDDSVHHNYKMLLTSMPTNKFPVSILQAGVKITNEPPRGIKANLFKTFASFDKTFDSMKVMKREWNKLVFGLSFFHALILERRKYGSLGWNIPYQFSQMDMAISMAQVRIFLEGYKDVQWKALTYMIAEANYGGRVTDPMDRRLIKVILSTFFTEEILDDSYRFSDSGIYFAPKEVASTLYRESTKEYIKELPLNDFPEVFGLHENANITSGINDTNELLETILSIQPATSGSGGGSSDDAIIELCEDIISKIPPEFDLQIISRKFKVDYNESMNTVLQQECIRFNKLTSTIKRTLIQLKKAIAGTVIMNNELEEVYHKLIIYKVPDSWHKVSYPSLKPLTSWFEDYLKRIEFINSWILDGKPTSFWISGFFFTQSFLTGTLQNFARKVISILIKARA